MGLLSGIFGSSSSSSSTSSRQRTTYTDSRVAATDYARAVSGERNRVIFNDTQTDHGAVRAGQQIAQRALAGNTTVASRAITGNTTLASRAITATTTAAARALASQQRAADRAMKATERTTEDALRFGDRSMTLNAQAYGKALESVSSAQEDGYRFAGDALSVSLDMLKGLYGTALEDAGQSRAEAFGLALDYTKDAEERTLEKLVPFATMAVIAVAATAFFARRGA